MGVGPPGTGAMVGGKAPIGVMDGAFTALLVELNRFPEQRFKIQM